MPAFVAPREQVIYDESADRFRADKQLAYFRPSFGSSIVSHAAREPAPKWSQLRASVVAPLPPSATVPLAFMHARRSPRGKERLVVGELEPGNSAALFYVRTIVFKRSSLFSPFVLVTDRRVRLRPPEWTTARAPFGARDLRVFAGQPDHADHSRFQIDFELQGSRAQLSGQLLDDDTVQYHSADVEVLSN